MHDKAARKAMFMETTQISESKTVAEIQQALASAGATAIQIEYAQGKVECLAFEIEVVDRHLPFRLPCRWRAVEAMLRKSGKRPKGGDTFDGWARRVAWRQILRWVEAQLALVETGMVKAEEVFLPYALIGGGKTMFESLEEKRFLAITGATETEGAAQRPRA